METPTPLESALDYAEERAWGLIEIVPGDLAEDTKTMFRINAGGREELLVEVGWGAAGLFADIRMYREDQPVEPVCMQLGEMVSVYMPPEQL